MENISSIQGQLTASTPNHNEQETFNPSLYMKSPFLRSIACTCLAAAILPASLSLSLLTVTLCTLAKFPYLFHKGFLYEVAIIDLIARQALTKLYPPLNQKWWHPVTDELIIGAIPLSSAQHHLMLSELGIKAVCSVLEPFELETTTFFSTPVSKLQWNNLGIEHRSYSCVDMSPMPLDDLIQAVEWVHSFSAKGLKTYVHCKQGRGRSACVILGVLIRYHHMSFDEAYNTLLSKRPMLSIREGQKTMLREYEKWNLDHPL